MDIYKKINISDNELLQLIRYSDEATLKWLYLQHKQKFTLWVNEYYTKNDELTIAVFRQAFIIFYLNIKTKRITKLLASTEHYLLRIGKYIFDKQGRKPLKEIEKLNNNFSINEVNLNIVKQQEQRYSRLILKESIDNLNESYHRILKLNYFCNLPKEKITKILAEEDKTMTIYNKYESLKILIEKINNLNSRNSC